MPQLHVKPSASHGLGVFARDKIDADTVIERSAVLEDMHRRLTQSTNSNSTLPTNVAPRLYHIRALKNCEHSQHLYAAKLPTFDTSIPPT